jgi:hypothetical protein
MKSLNERVCDIQGEYVKLLRGQVGLSHLIHEKNFEAQKKEEGGR